MSDPVIAGGTDATTNPDEEPLTPIPLGTLLDRIQREWTTRQRIFDLPTARFYNVSAGPDISASFLGQPIATPIGPAAGPHTQLAQNIVLAWLGGGRLFELKTVQIVDDLVIGRPCIDMETIGYNIEWSQELRVPDSLEEYVKASMMIEILSQWEPLKEYLGDDPGAHVLDLSVGYDLEGISSPKVATFIASMMDATDVVDRLRGELSGEWAQFKNFEFTTNISNTLTLSSFHGCPPDQIESITKHLMVDHGLDVIVKLNPTLLGYERVKSILHDTLGYTELELMPKSFDDDLQFDDAIGLINGLLDFAQRNGKEFGIKLSNTMILNNHRGIIPDDNMYMSGAPLHVLAMTLLAELHRALPGKLRIEDQVDAPIQVSWSAGITRDNLAASLGLGLVPATICSDLLKPGGYGRMVPTLKKLAKAMQDAEVENLAGLVAAAGSGSVERYVASLYSPESNGMYHKDGNSKLPRSVDHELEQWGCVACNFCVTVCPNDAFLKLPSPIEGSRWEYVVLGESCNECGNCMTFCPEDGDPAQIKSKLYLNQHRFDDATGPAFLIGGDDQKVVIQAKDDFAGEIETLVSILDGVDGLPIRPMG